MKLTQKELLHATNKQLYALGLKRDHNPGWMKRALQREFTAAEVADFRGEILFAPPTVTQYWKMEIIGPGGHRMVIEHATRSGLYAEIREMILATQRNSALR